MTRQIRVAYRTRPLPTGVREPFQPGQPFDMTRTARELHGSDARLRVLLGGLGSAKTHTLARAALFLAFENLGERGLVLEPDYSLIRDVWRPAFEEALGECELEEHRDWTFNKNEATYHLLGGYQRGGSTIICKSGKAWERIVGINAAWAVIDEPAAMPREAYQRVTERVRRGQERIVMAGTPNPGSWVVAFEDEEHEDCEVWHAPTRENPYASDSYIEKLLAELDPESAKAYLEGLCVVLAGSAYYTFKNAPWPDGNLMACEYDPELPVILACDNNRDPLCAALMQEVGDQLCQFDEIMLRGGSWSGLAETVHAKLGGVAPKGFLLMGDPVLRGAVTDEMTDWGAYVTIEQHLRRVFDDPPWVHMQVPKGHPLVVNRLESHRRMLCDATGARRYVMDPRCVETIKDHQQVQTNEEGTQILKGGKVDKLRTHLTDAVGYVIQEKHASKRETVRSRPRMAIVQV